MKSRNCRNGLIALSLALLAGCAKDRPSPAPTLTVSGCPVGAAENRTRAVAHQGPSRAFQRGYRLVRYAG
ncbi:MAG: Rz1-like lysis system protein LysC [Pseudomonas putida]